MALKLDVSKIDGAMLVQCQGRIVFGEEADELRRVVLGLLNESSRIILNLAQVAYVDSSGLDALVGSFISARNRSAEIKFAAISPAVRRVMTSTNVDRLFGLYDSNEEALKAFSTSREAASG